MTQKHYAGCDPIFVSRKVNRIYFHNLTSKTQKVLLETLFSDIDYITLSPGFSLLFTFNNLSLKCNTLHGLRSMFLHASKLNQKLTEIQQTLQNFCKYLRSVCPTSVKTVHTDNTIFQYPEKSWDTLWRIWRIFAHTAGSKRYSRICAFASKHIAGSCTKTRLELFVYAQILLLSEN